MALIKSMQIVFFSVDPPAETIMNLVRLFNTTTTPYLLSGIILELFKNHVL